MKDLLRHFDVGLFETALAIYGQNRVGDTCVNYCSAGLECRRSVQRLSECVANPESMLDNEIRALALAFSLSGECPEKLKEFLLRKTEESEDVYLDRFYVNNTDDEVARQRYFNFLMYSYRDTIFETAIALEWIVNLKIPQDKKEFCMRLQYSKIGEMIIQDKILLLDDVMEFSYVLKLLPYKAPAMIPDIILAFRAALTKDLKPTSMHFRELQGFGFPLEIVMLFVYRSHESRGYLGNFSKTRRDFLNAAVATSIAWGENMKAAISESFLDIENHIVCFANYKWFYETFGLENKVALLVDVRDPGCVKRLDLFEGAEAVKVLKLSLISAKHFSVDFMIAVRKILDIVFSNFDDGLVPAYNFCMENEIKVPYNEFYLYRWFESMDAQALLDRYDSAYLDFTFPLLLQAFESVEITIKNSILFKQIFNSVDMSRKFKMLDIKSVDPILESIEFDPEVVALYDKYVECELNPELSKYGIEPTVELQELLGDLSSNLQVFFAVTGYDPRNFDTMYLDILEDALLYVDIDSIKLDSEDQLLAELQKCYFDDPSGFIISCAYGFGYDNQYDNFLGILKTAGCIQPIPRIDSGFANQLWYSEAGASLEFLFAVKALKPYLKYVQTDWFSDCPDLQCLDEYQLLHGIEFDVDQKKLKSIYNTMGECEYSLFVDFLQWYDSAEIVDNFCGLKSVEEISGFPEECSEYTGVYLFVVLLACLQEKKKFLKFVSENVSEFRDADGILFDAVFVRDCIDLDIVDTLESPVFQHCVYDPRYQYTADTLDYLGSPFVSDILKLTEDSTEIKVLIQIISNKRDLKAVANNVRRHPISWYLQQDRKQLLTYDFDWDEENAHWSDLIIDSEAHDLDSALVKIIKSNTILKYLLKNVSIHSIVKNENRIFDFIEAIQLPNLVDVFYSSETMMPEAVNHWVIGDLKSWLISICWQQDKGKTFQKWLDIRDSVLSLKRVFEIGLDAFVSENSYFLRVGKKLSIVAKSEEDLKPWDDLEVDKYVLGTDKYDVWLPGSVYGHWKFFDRDVNFAQSVAVDLRKVS